MQQLLVSLEGFSVYNMSSENRTNYTSFQFGSPFFRFPCLIALPRTQCVELLRVGTLVSNLRGNAFRFSSLSDVSCVLITYDLCYVGVCFLCTQFVESFYHESLWILSYSFSRTFEMVMFTFMMSIWCKSLSVGVACPVVPDSLWPPGL